jgi:hypothetical protein
MPSELNRVLEILRSKPFVRVNRDDHNDFPHDVFYVAPGGWMLTLEWIQSFDYVGYEWTLDRRVGQQYSLYTMGKIRSGHPFRWHFRYARHQRLRRFWR